MQVMLSLDQSEGERGNFFRGPAFLLTEETTEVCYQ